MSTKKVASINVVQRAEGRFIVVKYDDGDVVSRPVLKTKAARKPRRPQQRLLDRTRKKQF
jgi:hypothetical protein